MINVLLPEFSQTNSLKVSEAECLHYLMIQNRSRHSMPSLRKQVRNSIRTQPRGEHKLVMQSKCNLQISGWSFLRRASLQQWLSKPHNPNTRLM